MTRSDPGSKSRWRPVRRAILGLGLLLLGLGLGADLLGLGEPGFGERQLATAIAGAILCGVSVLLRSQPGDPEMRSEVSTPAPTLGSRLRRAYRALALVLLNSLVALLLLDGLAFLGLAITDRAGWTHPLDPELGSPLLQISLLRAIHQGAERIGGPREAVPRLDDKTLSALYPGWPRARVAALLAESRSRALRFDPWTQFREKPFAGTFLHVAEPGFRQIANQGPWPTDPSRTNVWVLGGSTTFGYGVADEETIPSHLQQALQARLPASRFAVYDFGQGYFYSGQELALFTSLLSGGAAPPHLALFVDGINEHQAEPFFSDTLRHLVRTPWTAFLHVPAGLSIGDGREVVERYLRHKRTLEGIAAAYGIRTLFVWQPSPDWGYDLRYHPLWWEDRPAPRSSTPLFGSSPHYAAMDQLRRSDPKRLGDDFLWLGDLQRADTQPLYVDRLHYTGAFNRRIAEEIAVALTGAR